MTDGSESIPRGKQKLHTGGGMMVTPSLSLFISTIQQPLKFTSLASRILGVLRLSTDLEPVTELFRLESVLLAVRQND